MLVHSPASIRGSVCVQEAAALQQLFVSHMHLAVGPCLRLAASAVTTVRRMQRIFFLSESQDLSQFLVTQLGVIRYPEYRCLYPPISYTLPGHLCSISPYVVT